MFDNYPSSPSAGGSLQNNALQQVSFRKSIELNLKHHNEQVNKYTEMLKLLDENPTIEKFMDLSRG